MQVTIKQLQHLIVILLLFLAGSLTPTQNRNAPGAPGRTATWTNGNKQGVGTSVTLESKVWFTLGHDGILNEVYYPTVDVANVRTLQFIVSDGRTFADLEEEATLHEIQVVESTSLAFRQINRDKDGKYTITKTYITDPLRNTLLMNVVFESQAGEAYDLYVFYDPAINNSGMRDTGYSSGGALVAEDGLIASALMCTTGFAQMSSGFLGTSDGWTDLKQDFKLDNLYTRAANGNVVQTGKINLPTAAGSVRFTLSLGFGRERTEAITAAQASLSREFNQALQAYHAGWRNYVVTLRSVDGKYLNQFRMAAMILKAHEDKTYRGAMIASLTVPWGNQANANEPGVGGYHLVWSRDLYQVATAFMAMGDKAAADRALDYLFRVQQRPDGSFPQNSWLDGRPFWSSLQMDEVAYPLILAWQLGKTDNQTYVKHVKPAANFIVTRGPATPQERWEEESGYSPSTIAAEIAGLVCAAEIAEKNQDTASATRWRATADDWASNIERWTVTTSGSYANGTYYIRITENDNPNDGAIIQINNGGGTHDERKIVDAGFLELVRLGIKPPDDPLIVKSLQVVDQVIRVNTPNGLAWYRYNEDGYGEHPDGRGYDGTGKGRLWTLLSGERGEYVIASGGDARSYLDVMLEFANEGLMIPEQIWDQSDTPAAPMRFGEGTGSATPLAWAMAQFIRLAICIEEGRVVEMPGVVAQRYLSPRNSQKKVLDSLEKKR